MHGDVLDQDGFDFTGTSSKCSRCRHREQRKPLHEPHKRNILFTIHFFHVCPNQQTLSLPLTVTRSTQITPSLESFELQMSIPNRAVPPGLTYPVESSSMNPRPPPRLSSTPRYLQCTHMTTTRIYNPQFRCSLCFKPGEFGWLYRCTQDRELVLEDDLEKGNAVGCPTTQLLTELRFLTFVKIHRQWWMVYRAC